MNDLKVLLLCTLVFILHPSNFIWHTWLWGKLGCEPSLPLVVSKDKDIVEDEAVEVQRFLFSMIPGTLEEQETMVLLGTIPMNSQDPFKNVIQMNTMYFWRRLYPGMKSVVFGEGSSWNEPAKLFGMQAHEINETTASGVPLILPIFQHIQQQAVGLPFFGLANADILFGQDLLTTLQGVRKAIEDKVISDRVLIVGKRYHAKIDQLIRRLAYSGISDNTIQWFKRRSRAASTYAVDYFIFTQGVNIDWKQMPAFAIGRIGYDNWLVMHAADLGLDVIDASLTITCIHQTGMDGTHASTQKAVDQSYNLDLIPKPDMLRIRKNYEGSITRTPKWITVWDETKKSVRVEKRVIETT